MHDRVVVAPSRPTAAWCTPLAPIKRFARHLGTSGMRLRLAVALGLPVLASACKSAPPVRETDEDTADEEDADEDSETAEIRAQQGSLAFLQGDSMDRAYEQRDPDPVPVLVEPGTTEPLPPTCKLDEVREHVCGEAVVVTSHVDATPPFDRCPRDPSLLLELRDQVSWDHHRYQLGALYHFHWSAKLSAEVSQRRVGTADAAITCCYERCKALPVVAHPRHVGDLPAGMKELEDCYTMPEGTTVPAFTGSSCPAGLRVTLGYSDAPRDPVDDAPFVRGSSGTCCYSVATNHRCHTSETEDENGGCHSNPGGRPLREAGRIVVAPMRSSDEWCVPQADPRARASGPSLASLRERVLAAIG